MSIGQVDVAVRAGAAGLMLLLAWLLLGQRRQVGLAAVLFTPLALCVAGFVIGNTPVAALRPAGLVATVAHDVSGVTVPFLWWFCLSCFDSRFRPGGGVLAVGLFWAGIAAVDRGLLGTRWADRGLSYLLLPLGFAIVGHLVWRLLAERQGDLVQQRHDARIIVAVALGGMLFLDLSVDVLFGLAWRPLAFTLVQNALILGFGLWLAGRLLVVRAETLTFGVESGPPRPAASGSGHGEMPDDALRRRLHLLMEQERIFLDPELTLATFVQRMGAPERAVRTLVNHDLGHDHFRSFLNHYRVAEACRLLSDRARADKLITIAQDSGFASLASFNRAFRAVQGCSPSAYRARARQAEARQGDSGDPHLARAGI